MLIGGLCRINTRVAPFVIYLTIPFGELEVTGGDRDKDCDGDADGRRRGLRLVPSTRPAVKPPRARDELRELLEGFGRTEKSKTDPPDGLPPDAA